MYMCSDDDLAPNKTKPDGQNRKKNNKIENKPSATIRKNIEKANKYTLKPSLLKVSMDKEKKEPPTTNQYKNKLQ